MNDFAERYGLGWPRDFRLPKASLYHDVALPVDPRFRVSCRDCLRPGERSISVDQVVRSDDENQALCPRCRWPWPFWTMHVVGPGVDAAYRRCGDVEALAPFFLP